MFTEAMFFRAKNLSWLLIQTGLAYALSSPMAHAMLVLDPLTAAPTPNGKLSLSPPLSSGFLPLVFRPEVGGAIQIVSWPLGTSLPRQTNALHWHMQNAMPWPVTIILSLTDHSGGELTTRVVLPPGPPRTVVVPLRSVEPLTMGMRASPPPNFTLGHEPVLVATSVQGGLKGPPHSVSVSMPTPDVDQTVLLGKMFLDLSRDDLKSLYTGMIDCFGQFTRLDWPDKQKGDCEPTKQTNSSNAETALRTPTETSDHWPQSKGASDKFGGLLISGWPAAALASGAFRTYREPDRRNGKPGRWMLLTPLGNPFFSLGVNAVQLSNSETFIEGREYMFAALPDEKSALAAFYSNRDSTDVLPAEAGAQQGRGFGAGNTYDFYRANLYRKDGPEFPRQWRQRTRTRLMQWSFNTVAAWSDEDFIRDTNLSYTAMIHIHGPFQRLSDGHNWWQGIPDPFDPAFKQALVSIFSRAVPAHRNNARLIGYFVDNELAWGDGSSRHLGSRYGPVLSALAMDANESGAFAKRAFVAYLIAKYGDIHRLANAWQLPISSWQQIRQPLLVNRIARRMSLKNSPALVSDLGGLLALHASQYYRLVAQTLRKFDPDHLYLGSRFASRTPEAVSACVQFCDVVSFNLYVPDIHSGFESEQFAHHDKPALLTEFHFGSTDRGPFWGGIMSVPSESDRGPAYRRMLNSVVTNPQFVGAHWFQYLDQPASGRWLDGENGHFGLVSITDSPWREFTTVISETNEAALRQIAEQLRESIR